MLPIDKIGTSVYNLTVIVFRKGIVEHEAVTLFVSGIGDPSGNHCLSKAASAFWPSVFFQGDDHCRHYRALNAGDHHSAYILYAAYYGADHGPHHNGTHAAASHSAPQAGGPYMGVSRRGCGPFMV